MKTLVFNLAKVCIGASLLFSCSDRREEPAVQPAAQKEEVRPAEEREVEAPPPGVPVDPETYRRMKKEAEKSR